MLPGPAQFGGAFEMAHKAFFIRPA
jgi:hypothetical protein